MNPLKTIDKNYTTNRRKHPRFSIDFISEIYEVSRIQFITTMNISENGAGIVLPKLYDIGSKLDMVLDYKLCHNSFEKFERLNLSLKAEIVWIKKKNESYYAGLKIIYLDKHGQKKFHSYLQSLLENKRLLKIISSKI